MAAHRNRSTADFAAFYAGCPTPPNVITDPWHRPAPVPAAMLASMPNVTLSEQFANQRARFATAARQGPVRIYALRVGRRNNVVVVIEDRGPPPTTEPHSP